MFDAIVAGPPPKDSTEWLRVAEMFHVEKLRRLRGRGQGTLILSKTTPWLGTVVLNASPSIDAVSCFHRSRTWSFLPAKLSGRLLRGNCASVAVAVRLKRPTATEPSCNGRIHTSIPASLLMDVAGL